MKSEILHKHLYTHWVDCSSESVNQCITSEPTCPVLRVCAPYLSLYFIISMLVSVPSVESVHKTSVCAALRCAEGEKIKWNKFILKELEGTARLKQVFF